MSQTLNTIVKWTAYAAVGSRILWNVPVKVGGDVVLPHFPLLHFLHQEIQPFCSIRSKFNIGIAPVLFFSHFPLPQFQLSFGTCQILF
jgi:hypothetical protein